MENLEIMMRSYFKDKRVFLTGHTGFKGSWMLVLLQQLETQVKGYALKPEANSLYAMIGGDKLCQSIEGDLLDCKLLHQSIVEFAPDIIFHFAAQPLVRQSYIDPIDTYTTNAIGTAQVLEGVRKLDNGCEVIIITTDKVYYNQEWHFPYRENDRLGGYDPYSCSKACAELIVDSYRNSFFNIEDYYNHQKCISTARAGNVIGGGDMAKDRIIPDIIRALSSDTDIEVRNPRAVRPWQHVIEPLWGYLTLAYHMNKQPAKYQNAFNFGPRVEDCLTVDQLVDIAIDNWGSGKVKYTQNPNAPHESKLLKLDISNTEQLIGWSPAFDAKKAIELTISWYKKVLNGHNALKAVVDDLSDYFSHIGQ